MEDFLEREYGVKPVIREMVRTDVCFPAIKLLVERNTVVPVNTGDPESNKKAFRLQLSDGEKCIQALVRRRLHKTVLQLEIGRGSVIVLKEYNMRRAKRLSGDGEVIYLAIRDFYAVGFTELPDVEEGGEPAESANAQPPKILGGEAESTDPEIADHSTLSKEEVGDQEMPRTQPPSFEPTPVELLSIPTEQGSSTKEASSPEEPTIPRSAAWLKRAAIEHHRRCHTKAMIPFSECCPAHDSGAEFERFCKDHPLSDTDTLCQSVSHTALLAIMTVSPLKPYREPPKITRLASVTGRNKSRNVDVDILVAIESVDESTTKPARMDLKRDIRILDPSVDEPVTLSIFMDPVNFHASAGTIALFRHVTTHDWRRGNLNAYPARVAGREWFIPNPFCEPLGVRDEAQRMQEWWQEHEVLKHVSPHGSG